MKNIALCVNGYHGYLYLKEIVNRIKISGIYSYKRSGLLFDAFSNIKRLAESHKIPFAENSRPCIENMDYVFFVGWQYLVAPKQGYLVFHDSILPKYAGYNPLVTALINGDTKIGATGFVPNGKIDDGKIVINKTAEIAYPIKISKAYSIISELCCVMTEDIVSGKVLYLDNDGVEPSFSLWRDEDDYSIDWSLDSHEIVRMIDAVGWPYKHAKTNYNGSEIRIREAVECENEIKIANSVCGKFIRIEDGNPVVICGNGLVKILNAIYLSYETVKFDKVRGKFHE
jgi:methionyl-tRNA formyltransferase